VHWDRWLSPPAQHEPQLRAPQANALVVEGIDLSHETHWRLFGDAGGH
jgi:hypothetical protein